MDISEMRVSLFVIIRSRVLPLTWVGSVTSCDRLCSNMKSQKREDDWVAPVRVAQLISGILKSPMMSK